MLILVSMRLLIDDVAEADVDVAADDDDDADADADSKLERIK